MKRTVEISSQKYEFDTNWDGQVLTTKAFAFDTETTVEEDYAITPALALASASAGEENYLIHPDKVADFIDLHADKHWIFQNIAFDFWVIDQHLKKTGREQTRRVWWDIIDQNRAHDTMILDMLVRLAEYDDYPDPRNLGVLASKYCKMGISKEDPFRLRYGELIGVNWHTNPESVEDGFIDYAIKDPIVTFYIFIKLYARAKELTKKAGIRREIVDKWGVLTESIQIRGAISLYKITSNGIHVDTEYAITTYNKFKDIVNETTKQLLADKRYKDIFKFNKKTGLMELTKHGNPRMSLKNLRTVLEGVAKEIETDTGVAVKIPLTEKAKQTATSIKDWADYINKHPFLKMYHDLAEYTKLCQFFQALQKQIIHPRYTILVRTGRTSCYSPNLQQIPKKEGMREVFTAPQGKLILAVDYKFLEMRTLAHVLELMYEKSVMADVIRKDKDLHVWCAAIFNNMTYEEFAEKEKTDKAFFKKSRQDSKISNFGLSGGLGAKSLVYYAKAVYGVDISEEQANVFRNKWINEVFPEMKHYLSEDTMQILADNLCTSVEKCWRVLDFKSQRIALPICMPIRNIIGGKPYKKDGTAYSPEYIERVWLNLQSLNCNPSLTQKLKEREAGDELQRLLFWDRVTIPTGRIRGRVSFTQCKNCLDAETEALTKRGWVKGFDLTMDDYILTKNSETGILEWHKPLDLKFYPDYEGQLVEFKSRSFSAISTPDHRWLVYNKGTDKNECRTTSQLSIWGDHRIHRTGNYNGKHKIWSDKFVELCGWFLTDGHLSLTERKTKEPYPQCFIFQSNRANPEKVKSMEELLDELNASNSKQYDKKHDLYKYLLKPVYNQMLSCLFPKRILTTNFINTLTKEQAELLIFTMMQGDGTTGKTVAPSKDIFNTANKENAELFQMLCVIAGFSSGIKYRDMSKYTPKSKLLDNIPKMSGIWQVNIYRRDKVQVTKDQRREFTSKQPIWCPVVPNTYFVARREGKVFITGNSPFQGIAADGAKLAMWNLLKKGYHLIGFIHDEILVEIEDLGGYGDLNVINDVMDTMCQSMELVTGKVPIKGDFVLNKKWTKDGKVRIEGNKVYPLS